MEILYSSLDPAGINIALKIKDLISNGNLKISEKNLHEVDKSLLYSDEIANSFNTNFIVFASRHKSESGTPSFTIHVPGNWGKAEMGGKDKEISFSDPLRMKAIAKIIYDKNKKLNSQIKVTLEVDHHGPLCMRPCAFVEIGSSEKEWKNQTYANLIAEAICEFEDKLNEIEIKEVCVGVGGGHYCPAFNKFEFEGNVAFAHIIPNYSVDSLEYSSFVQAFERVSSDVDFLYIDWKGLKQEQKKKILQFSEEYGIDYKKV